MHVKHLQKISGSCLHFLLSETLKLKFAYKTSSRIRSHPSLSVPLRFLCSFQIVFNLAHRKTGIMSLWQCFCCLRDNHLINACQKHKILQNAYIIVRKGDILKQNSHYFQNQHLTSGERSRRFGDLSLGIYNDHQESSPLLSHPLNEWILDLL